MKVPIGQQSRLFRVIVYLTYSIISTIRQGSENSKLPLLYQSGLLTHIIVSCVARCKQRGNGLMKSAGDSNLRSVGIRNGRIDPGAKWATFPGPRCETVNRTIPGPGQWDPRKRDSMTIHQDANVNGPIPK